MSKQYDWDQSKEDLFQAYAYAIVKYIKYELVRVELFDLLTVYSFTNRESNVFFGNYVDDVVNSVSTLDDCIDKIREDMEIQKKVELIDHYSARIRFDYSMSLLGNFIYTIKKDPRVDIVVKFKEGI